MEPITDIYCEYLHDEPQNDYKTLKEVESITSDFKTRLDNYTAMLDFAANSKCLACKKCNIYKSVKKDMDTLYKNDNELFYQYLANFIESTFHTIDVLSGRTDAEDNDILMLPEDVTKERR